MFEFEVLRNGAFLLNFGTTQRATFECFFKSLVGRNMRSTRLNNVFNQLKGGFQRQK